MAVPSFNEDKGRERGEAHSDLQYCVTLTLSLNDHYHLAYVSLASKFGLFYRAELG